MADFEEQAPRPLALICGTLNTKDTAGFLRHFKGLAQETLAVPIVGDHAGRPADEVAAFAQSVGLEAAACQSVDPNPKPQTPNPKPQTPLWETGC